MVWGVSQRCQYWRGEGKNNGKKPLSHWCSPQDELSTTYFFWVTLCVDRKGCKIKTLLSKVLSKATIVFLLSMWLHFKVTSLGVTPHLHQCQDFFLNKIPLKAAFNYEHNWAQLLLHPAQFWPTLIGFLSFLWFLSFRLQGFWLFGTEGSGLPLVRACMRCMCQSRRPSVGCRQGEANTFVCFFLCFRFGKNCWFFFALEERGFRLEAQFEFRCEALRIYLGNALDDPIFWGDPWERLERVLWVHNNSSKIWVGSCIRVFHWGICSPKDWAHVGGFHHTQLFPPWQLRRRPLCFKLGPIPWLVR